MAIIILFISQQWWLTRPQELKISYFDVGQGDGILIQTPQKTNILIDAGPDNRILESLGNTLPFFHPKINIMILTHPHNDHLIGQIAVMQRMTVQKIYYTGVTYPTGEYSAWQQEVKQQNIPTVIVKDYFDLPLEPDIDLEFIYPNRDVTNTRPTDINDTSIVCRLNHLQQKFLFTGDASSLIDQELLTKPELLRATVLKVSHHGSATATDTEFLQAVNPTFAIISVGQDNSFDHPHYITIHRLEARHIEIFRTDRDGTVIVYSDGTNIRIDSS